MENTGGQQPPPFGSPGSQPPLLVTLGVLFVACAGFGAFGAVKAIRDNGSGSSPSLDGRAAAAGPGPTASKAAPSAAPATVQVVACVDLVTIGSKVKSCKIDKPKPSSIVMKEGTYRLSLYDVATRRKIFEIKLPGENETCPLLILIGNDRAVCSTLEDGQLTDVLRRFVEE